MNYKFMYDLLLMNSRTNAELSRMVPDYLIEGFYGLADLDNVDNFEEEFRNVLDNRESLIEDVIELYLTLLLESASKDDLVQLARENIKELERLHGGFDIEEDLEGAELIVMRLAIEKEMLGDK